MNFFKELKRRNVYRVTVAYLVTGWGVMNVTRMMIDALDLPEWTDGLVFILIIIGLVPTIIAAWALELTPEGIKLDTGSAGDRAPAAGHGRALNYFIIGMLTLIILGLLVERFYIADIGAPRDVAIEATDVERSVAVLPFVDLSQAQDQAWFGDGLAEEILNALARTPDIVVSSRTSAFAYKGTDKDLQTIARELNVAHILEGSIRGSGERLRITAQLIRARDDSHLWSQTYDRDAEDVIGIQEDIALRIATALETALDPSALEDMMRVGTRSVRAYRAYLQGLALRARSRRTGDPAEYIESYEQFETARDIDPRFAAAHREASDFWKVRLNPTRGPADVTDLTALQILENFLERIDLAISTATDAAEREGSRAQKAAVQLRLRTAIRRFQQYLDARPNDYRAWHEMLVVAQFAADRESIDAALAVLKSAGDADRFAATTYVSTAYRFDAASAADYGIKALQRWPNDAGLSYQTHRSLLWAKRIDEAADLIARMPAATSGNRLVRVRQACAEGRRADALQILEELRSVDGGSITSEWMILTLLGMDHEATELIRHYESGEVPYQLASFLVFHHFDPTPFPALTRMLGRENVQRPPAAEIPFACPAG